MPSLSDIPVDVLLDNLLPLVHVADLLHLSATSRFFAILGADETFWKRRLHNDFNFSGAGTARTTAWKTIYKGMSSPRIYTWGQNRNGRLGLDTFPNTSLSDVPFPVRVRIPGVPVVSLAAGGTSFHALDSDGNVYVWGTMDGTGHALQSDGFSSPYRAIPVPHRLILPSPLRSISCGRFHAAGLDAESQIWNFSNWGQPFRLVCDHINTASSKPIQVECGWGFSSALNKCGDVFVWFPFDQRIEQAILANEIANRTNTVHATRNKEIPCAVWDLQQDSFKLSALPSLPMPPDFKDDIKLVKIAGFDNNLIGLTNYGHVLKYDSVINESAVKRGQWTYLPNFSEAARVKQHQIFSSMGDEGPQVSDTMQITHISAHFRSFVAYSTGSSSVVLMGDMDTNPDSTPEVLAELQNIGVISVVIGDYHFGALTEAGKLLTWGQYSDGALGLGDPVHINAGEPGGFMTEDHRELARNGRRVQPSNVSVPTEVRFDHQEKGRRDMYCFAVTAAGWHMGALAIDLETNKEEENDSGEGMAGHFDTAPPPPTETVPSPGSMPSFARGGFRIGFAGRGLLRGGRGRG